MLSFLGFEWAKTPFNVATLPTRITATVIAGTALVVAIGSGIAMNEGLVKQAAGKVVEEVLEGVPSVNKASRK